jgi:hypothetical protein
VVPTLIVSVAGEKARLAMFTEFAEPDIEEFGEEDPYPEHPEREKIAIRVTIISVGSNNRFTILFIQSSTLFSNPHPIATTNGSDYKNTNHGKFVCSR